MTAFRLLPLSVALAAAATLPARAQNLVTLYEAARAFDAGYQSAQYQFEATVAKSEQARAGTLYKIDLTAAASISAIDNTLAGKQTRRLRCSKRYPERLPAPVPPGQSNRLRAKQAPD